MNLRLPLIPTTTPTVGSVTMVIDTATKARPPRPPCPPTTCSCVCVCVYVWGVNLKVEEKISRHRNRILKIIPREMTPTQPTTSNSYSRLISTLPQTGDGLDRTQAGTTAKDYPLQNIYNYHHITGSRGTNNNISERIRILRHDHSDARSTAEARDKGIARTLGWARSGESESEVHSRGFGWGRRAIAGVRAAEQLSLAVSRPAVVERFARIV